MNAILIGGAPGAGKTTLGRALARRHGLRLYSADTRTWEHRDRALAAGSAAAARFEALGPAAAVPDAELLAMSLHRERGPMVLDDLRALPPAPLIVAEGTPLPAAAAEPGRALWLVATPEVQRERLARRDGGEGGAAANQARLYALLAPVTEAEAVEHGVPVLRDAGLDTLEERFAAALAAGPRATTREQRRALLREMNEAVARQVRGYFTRPWAAGDAGAVEREFACECGDPPCTADVRATVAAAESRPVVAAGHDR